MLCIESKHDGPRTGDLWNTVVSQLQCVFNSWERHILLNLKGRCFVSKLQHADTCVRGQRERNIKEDFCRSQSDVFVNER